MKHHAAEVARDWLGLALAGLGITLAPHEFFGGLVLAVAAASLIARHRRSTRKLVYVMFTAAVVAIIAAEIGGVYGFWGWPGQLVMVAAGAMSSWLLNFFVKTMDQAEARSGKAADWLIDRIFPTKGKD